MDPYELEPGVDDYADLDPRAEVPTELVIHVPGVGHRANVEIHLELLQDGTLTATKRRGQPDIDWDLAADTIARYAQAFGLLQSPEDQADAFTEILSTATPTI